MTASAVFCDRVVEKPLFAGIAKLLLIVGFSLLAITADAAKKPASPVTLIEVKSETLKQQIKLTGTAVPWRKTLLSPRVNGLVAHLKVDEGSWVKVGDEVLLLDDRLAQIDIQAAQARIDEASAKHRDAVRKRDELLRLKDSRHIAQSSVDSAKAEVDSRAAALKREQVELERAKELAERHKVFAPFNGMVVAKPVEIGQWVQRDDPVIELVSVDTLRIRVPLPQRFYSKVVPGSKALVRFEALPDLTFEGKVFARLALGNNKTRSFPLLIDIPNNNHQLAPGMSARIWVQLNNGKTEALTVPRDAVISRADGSRILWRVRKDDGVSKVYAVTVETGRALGNRLELVGGNVKAGNQVVLLGNENLRQGQAVSPRTSADGN